VIEAGACRVPAFCLSAFCCARFLTFSPNLCGESLSAKNETFFQTAKARLDYDKIMSIVLILLLVCGFIRR